MRYRVELEDTNCGICYVEAKNKKEAESKAYDEIGEDSINWEPTGIEVTNVEEEE